MNTMYAGKLTLWSSLLFGVLFGALFMELLPLAESHPVFLLALPLACLLCVGVVLQPAIVVTLLLFSRALLDPLLNTTRGWGSGSIGFGAVLNLCVILMTFGLALKNPVPMFKSPFSKCWAFFLLICFAAVVYSPFQRVGMKLFFNLLSYFCMALLPCLVHPERNDKKKWIKILLLSSILPVLAANIDMLKGGSFSMDLVTGNRLLGSFTHPNILAFYLVWVMALVLYVWKSGLFHPTKLQNRLLEIYLINLFVLLIETKTRNAWIGAWLLFFIYGILKEKKYVLYCVVLAIAGLFLTQVTSRLSDLFTNAGPQGLNSLAWRMNVLKSSWTVTLDRWLLGHGLATFRELSGSFVLTERRGVDAHNVYLQLMFEAGIVGLAAYLSIYWQLMRAFYQRIKYAAGHLSNEHAVVLAYTLVYLINGMGDNLLYYLTLNWYCWFFWGVLLKAMQYQRVIIRPH
jgi:O-antigen ligase